MSRPPKPPEDEREKRVDPRLDTIEAREKRSGRGRPPPSRGLEAIVDKSVERRDALVVGALPAHVEVLAGGAVEVARVHPALVAATGSPLVVGDRIQVATLPGGGLYAVDRAPRTTTLARPAVEREKTPQPIVANADVVWVVVAVAEPPLKAALVDRFLVAAAAGGLEGRILATKLDLPAQEGGVEWLDYYERQGIRVVRTSSAGGRGLDELGRELAGAFSVLVGPSGVGKSSLVRAILPERPIAVGEVSRATGKGRHTTTVTRYYLVPGGGAVVDTPGLRELGLWGASREHLDRAFPDVTRLAARCRFDDCRHDREPGCAVSDAEELPPERLASFRKLSQEVDERLRPGFGKPGGPGAR